MGTLQLLPPSPFMGTLGIFFKIFEDFRGYFLKHFLSYFVDKQQIKSRVNEICKVLCKNEKLLLSLWNLKTCSKLTIKNNSWNFLRKVEEKILTNELIFYRKKNKIRFEEIAFLKKPMESSS